MPRFSANLGFLWADLPLLRRIESAAEAGFRAIELHWPYDVPPASVRQACTARGLTLLGLNSALGDLAKGESGLAALVGREADFRSAFVQSLAYCRDSGATSIHVLAGVVPAEGRAAATDQLVANLTWAAELAASEDVTILLEPLNARDKPGFLYHTLAPAAAVIERVGAQNVKLMFDVYHVGVSEGDVLKKLEHYLPVIGHMQLAAVPSRAEPDEGEIHYGHVLRAADALGYAGWVGCEYRPRGRVEDGLSWVQALGFSL